MRCQCLEAAEDCSGYPNPGGKAVQKNRVKPNQWVIKLEMNVSVVSSKVKHIEKKKNPNCIC